MGTKNSMKAVTALLACLLSSCLQKEIFRKALGVYIPKVSQSHNCLLFRFSIPLLPKCPGESLFFNICRSSLLVHTHQKV